MVKTVTFRTAHRNKSESAVSFTHIFTLSRLRLAKAACRRCPQLGRCWLKHRIDSDSVLQAFGRGHRSDYQTLSQTK
jgi:hypothetical protein